MYIKSRIYFCLGWFTHQSKRSRRSCVHYKTSSKAWNPHIVSLLKSNRLSSPLTRIHPPQLTFSHYSPDSFSLDNLWPLPQFILIDGNGRGYVLEDFMSHGSYWWLQSLFKVTQRFGEWACQINRQIRMTNLIYLIKDTYWMISSLMRPFAHDWTDLWP